jgi:hypothetical protein
MVSLSLPDTTGGSLLSWSAFCSVFFLLRVFAYLGSTQLRGKGWNRLLPFMVGKIMKSVAQFIREGTKTKCLLEDKPFYTIFLLPEGQYNEYKLRE